MSSVTLSKYLLMEKQIEVPKERRTPRDGFSGGRREKPRFVCSDKMTIHLDGEEQIMVTEVENISFSGVPDPIADGIFIPFETIPPQFQLGKRGTIEMTLADVDFICPCEVVRLRETGVALRLLKQKHKKLNHDLTA
ncbi:PilZ domain-containing protein [Magnetococcus sp. PR-3]|uniref:PilZ domain-containing protein n=1 Tax=Magnetococcus sp. PR-3 TaxID=3120355 RepID=UPI002FCE4137